MISDKINMKELYRLRHIVLLWFQAEKAKKRAIQYCPSVFNL